MNGMVRYEKIADRINSGPFEVSYCEQTGTATVRLDAKKGK